MISIFGREIQRAVYIIKHYSHGSVPYTYIHHTERGARVGKRKVARESRRSFRIVCSTEFLSFRAGGYNDDDDDVGGAQGAQVPSLSID